MNWIQITLSIVLIFLITGAIGLWIALIYAGLRRFFQQ